jgi:hypothetical protein
MEEEKRGRSIYKDYSGTKECLTPKGKCYFKNQRKMNFSDGVG